MRLVASVIARNEINRYLPLVLEHLLTYCDEARVLDDSSDDGTFEYLGGLREAVLVKRNPGPSFYEYESKARQALLEWTMQAEPDYVLSIDADEFVGEPQGVLEAMSRDLFVYSLEMREVWQASSAGLAIRVDGLWGPRSVPILWKAPKKLEGKEWQIPDRKLACGREPAAVRRGRAVPTGSSVFHFGWARVSEREKRFARYMEHDKGRYHRNSHLQSIMYPDSLVQTELMPWPKGLDSIRTRLISDASLTL